MLQSPAPTHNELKAVAMADENTGLAVGYVGVILRTADGGSSWVSEPSGTTEFLLGVRFNSPTTAILNLVRTAVLGPE